VVLCVGSKISNHLKNFFGIYCPVIPVKGYTFDIPLSKEDQVMLNTNSENVTTHISFRDKAFAATFLSDRIRIAGFGDLSGSDLSFDPKRVRYLKNLVA
jgi:glycine/D-amino acid oxidase-like deaminating enzyme